MSLKKTVQILSVRPDAWRVFLPNKPQFVVGINVRFNVFQSAEELLMCLPGP